MTMWVNTAAPLECYTVKQQGPLFLNGSSMPVQKKKKNSFDRRTNYELHILIFSSCLNDSYGIGVTYPEIDRFDLAFDSSAAGPHLQIIGRLTEK